MGKQKLGLIGPVRADLDSISVIGGMMYLIEAAQKLDHRVQFPLRGPIELGHELLLTLKAGNNLMIGDRDRVGELPLKPLRGAISVGLLAEIGADFSRQVQTPSLQRMAQATFAIADHALGQLFIRLREPDVCMRFQTST